MAAFRRGWELGAGLLELDIHVSSDGMLVVMHDDTVDRTTNGHGPVKDLSVRELGSLDAGSWFAPEFAGERVPLLGEVIEWARGKIGLAIEVKNGPTFYPGIAAALVRELRQRDFVQEALVISFDHRVLREVKDLEPEVRVGMLYVARLLDPVAAAHAVGAAVMRPRQDLVTAEDVHLLHQAGIAVSPWTVNDPDVLERCIAMGVDSMGSDYPDRLRAFIDARLG